MLYAHCNWYKPTVGMFLFYTPWFSIMWIVCNQARYNTIIFFLCNLIVSCDPSRPLPHTLYPIADTDLCLITKREKKEAKEFLKEKKVEGISKVVCMLQLAGVYNNALGGHAWLVVSLSDYSGFVIFGNLSESSSECMFSSKILISPNLALFGHGFLLKMAPKMTFDLNPPFGRSHFRLSEYHKNCAIKFWRPRAASRILGWGGGGGGGGVKLGM